MASDDIRPFRVEVPEAVLDDLRDRLARTRWPDQIPGIGLGLRHRPRVPAGPLRDWRTTFDWRAQEDAVQPLAALPHRHRRPADPLHPRPLRQSRRAAVDHHARLAGFGRRVPRRDRTVARGLPRRRAVAARLRMVGPDDRAGLGRAARRRGVGGAHGAPRLRPVRRAGRRLGRDDLGPARRDRRRAHGRAAQQHAARVPRRRERDRAHRRRRSPISRRPASS